ncbi:MAG: hypothetical protein C0519_06720 [Hyphomicrobium sp.]|nr:hypothetical protein [Hyphomicrobium sp.]
MARVGKRNYTNRIAYIAKIDAAFIEQQAQLLPQLLPVSELKAMNANLKSTADKCHAAWRAIQKIQNDNEFTAFLSVFDYWCDNYQIDAKMRPDCLVDEKIRLDRTITDLQHFEKMFRLKEGFNFADTRLDMPGRHILINTIKYMRDAYGCESAPPQDGNDPDLCIIIELIYEAAGMDPPTRTTIAEWQRNEVPRVVKKVVHSN